MGIIRGPLPLNPVPNNPLDQLSLGFQRGNNVKTPEIEGPRRPRDIMDIHRGHRSGDSIPFPVVDRIMDEPGVYLGVVKDIPPDSLMALSPPLFPPYLLQEGEVGFRKIGPVQQIGSP